MSMFGDAIRITAKISKDNKNFKEGEILFIAKSNYFHGSSDTILDKKCRLWAVRNKEDVLCFNTIKICLGKPNIDFKYELVNSETVLKFKDTVLNFVDKIKITKKIKDKPFYKVGDTVTLIKSRMFHEGLNTVIDSGGDLWGFVNNDTSLNVCLGRPGIDFEFEVNIKNGIFKDAQVGDEVYGRLFGEGTIINANSGHPAYSIIVKGTDGHNRAVTFDGRNCETDKEPTWFYRSGNDKYLTERPVRTVPAHLVPIDTKIECKSFIDAGWKKRHYADKPMRCWSNGSTSWSDSRFAALWEQVRLGESIEINGIKYEAGCEIKPVK